MKNACLLLFCSTIFSFAVAQNEIKLYPGPIPNSKPVPNKEYLENSEPGKTRIHNITVPTLTVFVPQTPNGTAIIICPGGGYSVEAMKHEGLDVAEEMNKLGVTCFVLKYRLPNDSSMVDKTIGPLQDAERAIQMVREERKRWGIKKDKIGIMGFSAGGHLASTAGTHFNDVVIDNPKKTSLRPDYMVLAYPVINLTDSFMHAGSRNNLLGKNPSKEMIEKYSNDLQVTSKTPPTFLVQAKDDKTVSGSQQHSLS